MQPPIFLPGPLRCLSALHQPLQICCNSAAILPGCEQHGAGDLAPCWSVTGAVTGGVQHDRSNCHSCYYEDVVGGEAHGVLSSGRRGRSTRHVPNALM
eukprot:scaffold90391_cov63-Phaeocystis_antarctica.AAC.1